MFTTNRKTLRPALATLLLGALMATPAGAASKGESAELAVRYQKERSDCMARTDAQDRSVCLKDASAAYAEARRHGLNKVSGDYQANQMRRCEALQGDNRSDCIARMRGAGTATGSVDSGGIYRELVTIEVGVAPAAKSVSPSAQPAEPPTKN